MPTRAVFLAGRLLSAAASPTLRSRYLPAVRALHGSAKQQQEAAGIASQEREQTVKPPASARKGKAAAQFVNVTIGGIPYAFPALFLRDACSCPKCVDASTQQKSFQTSDIPQNIEAVVQPPSANGSLRLSWANDHPATAAEEHITEFSAKWLREANARQKRLANSRAPLRDRVTWDRQRMEKDIFWIDYKDYASSDSGLLQTLRQLQTHGLVFLRNVPDDEMSVVSVAERIGPLRDSFYGRTWDVRSVPNATNVAYTDKYLGLHMDLLYMTNPPHLQFLHSLHAKAPGGESLFSDSFHAAEIIREKAPDLFFRLATYPVTYHYKNDSQHYEATRPTIELEIAGIVGGQGGTSIDARKFWSDNRTDRLARRPHKTSAISRINWSPPFQAPFQQALWAFPNYHEGASMLNELVNAEENVFEYRLAEGECVIFDNRRVLHARKAFDIAGGERWLKGAYVDDDAYWSRLRVLEEAEHESSA